MLLRSRRASPRCLSDAQLDALLCDVASASAAQSARAHLASCVPCRARLDELDAATARLRDDLSDAEILALASGARHRRSSTSGGPLPTPQSTRRALAAAVAAAAVAAIFLLALRTAPRRSIGVRAKGSGAVSVQVLRDGRTFMGQSGDRYFQGDTLQFALTLARPTHVAVFDREASGAVAVFYPWRGGNAGLVAATAPGEPRVLEPAIALDDSVGPEWLVAIRCETPFSTAPIAAALASRPTSALPALTAGDLELPGGCSADSFELDKQPGGSR